MLPVRAVITVEQCRPGTAWLSRRSAYRLLSSAHCTSWKTSSSGCTRLSAATWLTILSASRKRACSGGDPAPSLAAASARSTSAPEGPSA